VQKAEWSRENCTARALLTSKKRAVAERRGAERTTRRRNEVELAVRKATIKRLAESYRQYSRKSITVSCSPQEHSGGRRSYDVDAMAVLQKDPAKRTQSMKYMYIFPWKPPGLAVSIGGQGRRGSGFIDSDHRRGENGARRR